MIRLIALTGLLMALASSARADDEMTVRVGFFPNLTHAQALVAHNLSRQGHGWFEERLGPGVKIEWSVYNAGPSAMEAILTRSLDLTYVGPNPAINAHLKSEGKEIRIVAGSCVGGAALLVRADSGIKTEKDFRGKTIATPQLGNTQDVAARAWLMSAGHKVTLTGGDLRVVPTSNADQLMLFQKKELDAIWTVEPWVSRLEEAGATVFLDEKELWPETGGRYITTHLVSRTEFLAERPDLVRKWVSAHVELTQWMNEHPEESRKILNAELQELTTRGLSEEILTRAWNNLELTWDPVRQSLNRNAQDAHRIGFIKKEPDLSKIYELSILNDVLRERNLPLIP